MAALKRFFLFAVLLIVLGAGAACATNADEAFANWRQGVAEEATADGIDPTVAQEVMSQVRLDERVLTLDQKQPETTITFADYLRRTLTPDRVAEGQRLLHEHAGLLLSIYQKTRVPPAVVVALWGIESSFGKNPGDYKIVDSLATLAFEGRRAAFFRTELIDALKIIDQAHMSAGQLKGSWAGAMGQCQFMPSTYLKYAVSFSGTSAADIWTNTADVLTSIASYLAAEGWQGQGWGQEVRMAKPLAEREIGISVKHSAAEWSDLGVRAMNGEALVTPPGSLSIVAPDGPEGRTFLVYDNYGALMRWNRSTFFATTVSLLADRISDDR